MRRTAILTAIGFSLCVAPAALAQTPPDPLANLAADVSAVLDGGERPQILLNETDHDVNSTRTIGVGDEYRDGWKITAITSASVTLNKGRDTRTIALAGRRQTQAAAAPAPGAANVAASNSLVGGSGPGRGGPRSLELQTAIGAGNVKQVLQMGGSAADAAAALQAQGRAPVHANNNPGTAAFVQIGDRYGLAMTSPDGSRQQIFTTPDFDGFVPTGPVRQIAGAPNVPAGSTGTFITTGGAITRQAIAPAVPPTPVSAPPAPPAR